MRERKRRRPGRSREELVALEDEAGAVQTPLDRTLDFHMRAGNRAAGRAFAEAGSMQGLWRSTASAGSLTNDESGGPDDLAAVDEEAAAGDAEAVDQTPGIAAEDADAAIAGDGVADTSQMTTPAAPAGAPIINSRTDMHAPDGTPDTRQIVAMGEVIYFDVGGDDVDWTASAGWPGRRSARSTFAWELPQPGTATITATNAKGLSTSVTITALAPTDVRMRKVSDDPPQPSGRAGAGMMLMPAFSPGHVNFGNVEWLEVPGGPTNLSGYFAARSAAGADLNHHPAVDFLRIGPRLRDHASAFKFRPPYSTGTWDWSIPNRFRRAGTNGQGELYFTTLQTFRIDASGTITVTKQGATTSSPATP
jgi:hypothetical protein